VRTNRKAKLRSTNRESLAVTCDAGDPSWAAEPIALAHRHASMPGSVNQGPAGRLVQIQDVTAAGNFGCSLFRKLLWAAGCPFAGVKACRERLSKGRIAVPIFNGRVVAT
jgi:hypothetical protein